MSTEKYQSGVRRQINPEFTLSPSQYLSKYDPFKAAKKKTVKSGMDFAVFPVATIPGTIKTFIKRKKENTGIKFLDGPTTLGDSLFLQSIAATQDRY